MVHTGPEQVSGRVRRFAGTIKDSLVRPTDVQFVDALLERGIKDVFAVSCSITAPFDALWRDYSRAGKMNYWKMVNEHSLGGVAAGVYLGTGELALAHMQNSGIGNAADAYISFAAVFKVPSLAIVTWRGNDLRDNSEPHQEIGRRTAQLTRTIADKGGSFGERGGRGILRQIDKALDWARAGNVSIIRLSPDAFKPTYPLELKPSIEPDIPTLRERHEEIRATKGLPLEVVRGRQRISRVEAIQDIISRHPDAAIIFSNGYTSRDAQAHTDRIGNLYNPGYMGGGLALGWGMAMSNPDIEVVVVDGDQNAQMGKMTEILANNYPSNLHWEILDNGFGVSVGVAESNPLPWWFYDLARVTRTIPDPPGSFKAPRVGKRGAYFDTQEALDLADEIGPLPAHMQRFRSWVESRTRKG